MFVVDTGNFSKVFRFGAEPARQPLAEHDLLCR